jgi:hypothetical protein
MALKGNLRDFTITQLLNLIHLARKTGMLVIEGTAETSRLGFREGKLAFVQIGEEDSSLPGILKQGNKITYNQYRILREKAGQMTDKELGLLLINAGYLSQRDILSSLQLYCTGAIRRLFTWAEGLFRFESDAGMPADRILVRMDLENLIMEGSRQLREWEQLQEEIPSLDIALRFTNRPGMNIKGLNLSVEEWRVLSYVNPKNTIRQIKQTVKMSELEIRRVVYGLLQAGLVELVRQGGAQLPAKMFPTANREDQKSLINRLIDRIRAIK